LLRSRKEGAMTKEHFASGNWRVKAGQEGEFITRWKDWLASTSPNIPGFGSATLLQDVGDPQHFISFSDWENAGARDSWKASPEFQEKHAFVREVCDDFQGGDYTRVGGS
jgi:heme-degrading monooxygenase HmoA